MKLRSVFYIVLAGIFWGTSGLFVHFLAPYGFSSLQMTAVRGTVSFLCIAVYVLVRSRESLRVTPRRLIFCIGAGASVFGTAACYFSAMQLTSIATAVVLMYMAPVLVTVFSVLFLKERFTLLKGISVALMVIGCALVSGVVGGLKFHPVGILLGILSAIVYAAYSVFTKLSLESGCAPMTSSFYSYLTMAALALSVSAPHEIVSHAAKDPLRVIPVMIALGIVTFILPYFLYTLAVRELPAGTASALSIVEPMAATVFSVVIFKEKLGVAAVIGIVLILGAVILLSREESDGKQEK